MSFKLPSKPEVLTETALGVCHQYTPDQIEQYGIHCAQAVLEEVATRMRNNADETVAKWEEIGDDEDVIHAKSAAFSVYVHAASIRKFAAEINKATEKPPNE